jgi:HEAT repeat protein
LLRLVLADSDPDSVASAAEELVRLKHPEGVVEALSATYRWSKSTDTSASGPRQRPVEVLSRSQLPAAIPLLREALADPEATIRIAAASGLARLGEAEGLTELRRILDGGQPVDALKAAEALVDIGSTAPTPTAPSL